MLVVAMISGPPEVWVEESCSGDVADGADSGDVADGAEVEVVVSEGENEAVLSPLAEHPATRNSTKAARRATIRRPCGGFAGGDDFEEVKVKELVWC